MDESGKVILHNHEFYKQFGLESGQIDFEHWLNLVHPLDRLDFSNKVEHHISTDQVRDIALYRVRKANGQYIWLEGIAVTHKTHLGHYMIGIHRDISERKLMESYLHRVAFHDNASGVPNRACMLLDITKLCNTNKSNVSIIYIQIVNVKSYFNQYGSELVNELVEKLLVTLSDQPLPNTQVYRVQDDSFALLIRDILSTDTLTTYACRIKQDYSTAVKEAGFHLGGNISIGLYPSINLGHPAEENLQKSARTCRYAQEKAPNSIAVYSLNTQMAVDRHFFIKQGLQDALDKQSLSVKFQPIICSKSGSITSFETLVRWNSEEFGEIFPDEFIPVAEKKGLIMELGYQVFTQACHFIKEYRKRHKTQVRINVNVSALQLLKSEFPTNIKHIADSIEIEPQAIILELTETFILDNNQAAIQALNTLNKLGFALSLDDFGAGYSSLHCFFDLPMTQIKIDKSMAWKALNNSLSFKYLHFLIDMCQEQNIEVVIEGVENEDMYQFFKRMKADLLQGYYFSSPISPIKAIEFIPDQAFKS
ncbi:sensor domain-containing phosphodiesterase [Vibrio sagamiensis NBRC 104589]|uniref:Sensor domain-containing phosphodiesterase n=2 Tax=Vibrio sagamiensis TaxID=512650 RepID=A0A511QB39_9VIBR|nr:sensor domain-containing phosphodiesterase [Vibrio sagamiensis NBRC 104589]